MPDKPRQAWEEDGYDVTEVPEVKAALMELFEARMQHYREHPESACTPEQLFERMKTWPARRKAELAAKEK